MIFKPRNFERWIEDDVREEIITPLLHRLGYEKDTENDIRREQYLVLRYNKESLGKQKPKTDPILSGYADYILDVGNKIRWVIEAKSPVNQITEADVAQAYSYARHSEIRAVCYCLCNGRELRIYRTDYAPEAALLLSIPYEEFEEKFDVIANILSPDGMRRTWPEVVIDTEKPLGPRLRSIVRVAGGQFRYTYVSVPNQLLEELIFTVTGGAIERNEDGKLIAFITTRSPLLSAQKVSERIGTNKMELLSNDTFISIDANTPTVFAETSTFVISQGERILDFTFPQTFVYKAETTARGYLNGLKFEGTFDVVMLTNGLRMDIRGTFEVHLV